MRDSSIFILFPEGLSAGGNCLFTLARKRTLSSLDKSIVESSVIVDSAKSLGKSSDFVDEEEETEDWADEEELSSEGANLELRWSRSSLRVPPSIVETMTGFHSIDIVEIKIEV